MNSKRMTSLVYLSHLVLALLLIIPFYRLFVSVSGNSLLPNQLINDFDATSFGEFLRQGGKSFGFYLKGLLPWLLLFLLLSTFFQGGILFWISNPRGRFSSRGFLDNCLVFFWPFVKTLFYTLLIQIIFALIVYLSVSIIVGGDNLTDAYIGKTVIIGIAIHLVLLIWGTMIADFTRIFIFRTGKRHVLKSLWKAVKFSFKKIAKLFAIYFIWVIVPLLLFVVFYLIRTHWSIKTGLMVFLLFIVQQAFIWLRFLLKIQKTSIFYGYLILVDRQA